MASDREKRIRDVDIRFRLTEAERDELRNAASLAGISLSAWIRERLFKAARREEVHAARMLARD